MRDLQIEHKDAVNTPLLDAEIRAALGADKIAGISTDGETVIVHLLDESIKEAEARAAVNTVLRAHDPAALTADQQKREAVATNVHSFIEAPEIDARTPLTTAQLTQQVADLQRVVRLLLGAREAKG